MTIQAIETYYAGCWFRSRLEARWAVFFDALSIRWEYEPQGYVLDGRPYLPDFRLITDGPAFVEVKPDGTDEFEGEHVYLCQALAHSTNHPVLLLIGSPAHRAYHRFTATQAQNDRQLAFFTDWRRGSKVQVVDAWWAQSLVLNQETEAWEFLHTGRELRKSFGQGLVDAVQKARSARFEHGEQP